MDSNAGDAATPGPPALAPGPGVWLTEASLFLMAMIWGVNFVVVKFVTTLLPLVSFTAVRVSLAAATLVVIAMFGRTPWPGRRDAMRLIGLGMLGNGVYQLCFIHGVAATRVADAALLIAATPAFIALIGRVQGVERVGGKGWIGILMSIAGIVLVSGATALAQSRSALIGDLLILLAALCWAFYTVMLKPLTHRVDGVKLSALTMVGGALALVPYAWTDIRATRWQQAPSAAYLAMVYSGIGGLVIAYLFWYRGVRILGPTRTAMYSNLQPVVAVLVAWVILGELPTVWQGIGAASIMSGLLLTRT